MPAISNVNADSLKGQPNSTCRGSDLHLNFGKDSTLRKSPVAVKLSEPENTKPRRDVVSF